MPDQYFHLDMSRLHALQTIYDYLTDRKQSARADFIRKLPVSELPLGSGLRLPSADEVRVHVPFPSTSKQKTLVVAFVDLYKSVTGKPDPRSGDLAKDTLPLVDFLPRLLISEIASPEALEDQPYDQRKDYVRAREGDRLYMLTTADDEGWQRAYDFEAYAPPIKVAYQPLGDGADEQRLFVYHVHVNDDVLVADRSGEFEGLACTYCYPVPPALLAPHRAGSDGSERDGGARSHECVIGLPEQIVPLKTTFEWFVRILLSAPALFDAASAEPGWLLALVGETAGRGIDWFHTGHLRFYPFWQIISDRTRPRLEPATRFHNLRSGETTLAQLIAELDRVAADIGYELKLRPAHYSKASPEERERLREDMHEINERLTELQVLERAEPRPILLRFTQHQLPALADVLRSHHPSELEQIKYAFAATVPHEAGDPLPDDAFDPGGVHFLYYHDNLPLITLEPMLQWEDHRPTRHRQWFWLDPYWSATAVADTAPVQLFVPHGTRLWPSLFASGVDEPDRAARERKITVYFRGRLAQWLRKPYGSSELPRRALCLFDGHPTTDGLTLTVLDQEQFKPITSVSAVRWINTNLHILQAHQLGERDGSAEGVRAVFERLDRVYTAERLNTAVLGEALEREKQFQSEAAVIVDQSLAATSSVAEAFTETFKSQLKDVQAMLEKAVAMSGELGDLQREYDALQNDARLFREAEKEAAAGVVALAKFTSELGVRVSSEIDAAQTRQTELVEKVTAMLKQLGETRNRLEDELETVHGYLEDLRRSTP